MTWEEHIAKRLEAGYFDTSDYVVLFRKGNKVTRITEPMMIACSPANLTITTREIKPTEADSVRLIHSESNLKRLELQISNPELSGMVKFKFPRPIQ